MPERNQAALDFLLTRRSRPAKTLTAPAPEPDTVHTILTAAARTPDHGKLEPWRFIILEKAAMPRLADLAQARGQVLGLEDEMIRKGRIMFDQGQLCVAVVASPKASDKIPEIEQTYSAGAVCLALLNTALASGWGANWLSGWPSHDRDFIRDGLGLEDHEGIAGLIFLGTEKATPPDRPRPDLAAITTWVRE